MNTIQTEYADVTITEVNGVLSFEGVPVTQRGESYYIESPSLAATHNAKGQDYIKREAFIKRHGLKESASKVHPSWLVVLPAYIRRGVRNELDLHRLPSGIVRAMERMHDHAVLFQRNGEYLYTTQPYDVTPAKYRRLCYEFTSIGLTVDISINDAWWYPGRTPLIVIGEFDIELTK